MGGTLAPKLNWADGGGGEGFREINGKEAGHYTPVALSSA